MPKVKLTPEESKAFRSTPARDAAIKRIAKLFADSAWTREMLCGALASHFVEIYPTEEAATEAVFRVLVCIDAYMEGELEV